MTSKQESFTELYDLVRTIPIGKVMSYGQAGFLSGYTARQVGRAMANCEEDDVPWFRVVGFWTDTSGSAVVHPCTRLCKDSFLSSEGVQFKKNNYVDMDRHQVNDFTDNNIA